MEVMLSRKHVITFVHFTEMIIHKLFSLIRSVIMARRLVLIYWCYYFSRK